MIKFKKICIVWGSIFFCMAVAGCGSVVKKTGEENQIEVTLALAPTEAVAKDTVTEQPKDAVIDATMPTATSAPESTVTNTPEPTVTDTPEPTVTDTPEPTVTNTPEPTATNTPEPATTSTPTPAVTSTPTPTATSIPISAEGETAMWSRTTMEIVRDMGIGINLGNTFESFGDWIRLWGDGSVESYMTGWGSPVIVKEMIQGYAEEGFGVLRVPVHWFNLMDEEYNINPEYLAAVQEVVDWAIEADLYVIVNIHHDEGDFFAGFPEDKEGHMTKYIKVWEQLAEAFRDYDERLMLESLNEEGGWDSLWDKWGDGTGKEEAFAILNDINQAFVDTVRASGGNNTYRHLLIAGYQTGLTETCDALFLMPKDPANRCAVSVHYYVPSVFAILEEDADWGKSVSTWGTDADFKELKDYMTMMKTHFVDNGIPVIVGEFGCPKKNKDADSVRLFLYSVCKEAYDNRLCPVLWDVTGLHYDRENCRMYDRELRDALMSVLDGL